jgi:hypothetical protein
MICSAQHNRVNQSELYQLEKITEISQIALTRGESRVS